ncbi:unnamed protein product [Rotaria sordida]|uniref:ABC transmembrane type-1 domain-containing protein n=1 Tax=Rotaria sordida TaxID=392033 RepID=A0A819I630_9BILA|nr:unnamed protein product [Rotaria sordida]CAF1305089.1 unnamed protein product [Rotaria sordida]CAF3913699.1 unnamed protein product [Rotaria sordida]CAF4184700.1 unnamed protein product [Rotaria sordida]
MLLTIIAACIIITCGYIRTMLFNISAERQARSIRQTLFQSILKQDITFFDEHKTGELASRLTDDIDKIRGGISDKLGSIIELLSMSISNLIVGLVKGWKLTLVVLATSPLIVITTRILFKVEFSDIANTLFS